LISRDVRRVATRNRVVSIFRIRLSFGRYVEFRALTGSGRPPTAANHFIFTVQALRSWNQY
jgi:hypothetical protein